MIEYVKVSIPAVQEYLVFIDFVNDGVVGKGVETLVCLEAMKTAVNFFDLLEIGVVEPDGVVKNIVID